MTQWCVQLSSLIKSQPCLCCAAWLDYLPVVLVSSIAPSAFSSRRASLVNFQGASLKIRTVQCCSGCFSFRRARHINKSEISVGNYPDALNFTIVGKQFSQLLFTYSITKISYIETATLLHSDLLFPPNASGWAVLIPLCVNRSGIKLALQRLWVLGYYKYFLDCCWTVG